MKYLIVDKGVIESKYFVPACYALFFILGFLVFFYHSFPSESFKRRIIYEVETRTPFDIDIRSLSIYPIFSLKLHDVKLYRAKALYLNVDDLDVSPSLFYLLLKKITLPFRAHLYGGNAKGKLVYSSTTRQLIKANGTIEGINVKGIPAISIALGDENSSIQGVVEGFFSVEFGPQPKGQIALETKDLTVKNVRLIGGLPLPDFGRLESNFKSHIENGATKVEELKFQGNGFDLTLFGTMPLLWEISRLGAIDLDLRLRTEGVGKRKLGFLSAFLSPQSDGSLKGKITGTFGSPRLIKEVVGVK
jgi:type II secretion system protein N